MSNLIADILSDYHMGSHSYEINDSDMEDINKQIHQQIGQQIRALKIPTGNHDYHDWERWYEMGETLGIPDQW